MNSKMNSKMGLVMMLVIVINLGGSAKADFTFGTPANLGPTVNSSAHETEP